MKIQHGDTVRNATPDEVAAYENAMATIEQAAIKDLENAASRVSALTKLKALGLTDDEIAALVGL